MIHPELESIGERFGLGVEAINAIHMLLTRLVRDARRATQHQSPESGSEAQRGGPRSPADLQGEDADVLEDVLAEMTVVDVGEESIPSDVPTHAGDASLMEAATESLPAIKDSPRERDPGWTARILRRPRIGVSWMQREAGSSEKEMLGRYEDLGLLGRGGMGEVRRVRDGALRRSVAMKIIHPHLMTDETQLQRFREEAQAVSQLQHPGILPIHEMGRLPDGRGYFTMQEIRGETLSALIKKCHAAAPGQSEWTLRRLMDVFRRICQTVAYAHDRGVIHRDLKPSNVMIGRRGEAWVVDWGIAKVTGRAEPRLPDARMAKPLNVDPVLDIARLDEGIILTEVGVITGTPNFMSPEQAWGDDVDARADVYALGGILYVLLSGRLPYREHGRLAKDVVTAVRGGPPRDLRDVCQRALPAELVEICEQAMARSPDQRFEGGEALASAVEAWLEGAKRRELALAHVEESRRLADAASELRRRHEALRREATALLEAIPAHALEEEKHLAWDREDRARSTEHAALLRELGSDIALQRALSHEPDLEEAHEVLVERYGQQHLDSEQRGDDGAVLRAETWLQRHLQALSEAHPVRQRWAAYLKGTGALTLWTDPPGARVQLFQYVEHHRRLYPRFVRELGLTPLDEVALAPGSYLLLIERDGFQTVRYPVWIGRQEHWNGVRPGDRQPTPIWLPPEGHFLDREVYVPAGWFRAGGDPGASGAIERRRLWCDPFVVSRWPISNAQFLFFLDDLVSQGEETRALDAAPRERSGTSGEVGALIYGRRADGTFELRPDADGDMWQENWPVCMIDWWSAQTYCDWLAERSGAAWELSNEWHWEKAARGVDGRIFPWGQHFDSSWCGMRDSTPGPALPEAIGLFSVDESPWGVRDIAGGIQEWCGSIFRIQGPDSSLVEPSEMRASIEDKTSRRVSRGGSWSYTEQYCRPAYRRSDPPHLRAAMIGVRPFRVDFKNRSGR